MWNADADIMCSTRRGRKTQDSATVHYESLTGDLQPSSLSFSLARQLQKEVQSTNASDFTEEQKVISAFTFTSGQKNEFLHKT